MDSKGWDARYSEQGLLWSADPNRFLVQEVEGLHPGRALDVACGEGRNAVWLAGQGWRATGVDFSPVGLAKARKLAEQRGVDVRWVEADLAGWSPDTASFDLVAIFYLHLPEPIRRAVYSTMATGVASGGTMLVVGHDRDNLVDGYGGPQDESVLLSAAGVAADLAGLEIVKAEQVRRSVETAEGVRTAIDTLVRATRP